MIERSEKKASSPNARKQKRKSKNGFGLEKASKERIFSKKIFLPKHTAYHINLKIKN